MPKIVLTPRELIRLLERNGFHFVRQNGSHAIFRNFENGKKVVVPIHNKDIPTGTLHAIIRDAGIEIGENK